MTGKKLSRRDFLRMGAMGVAGAALAGCCPAPEPEIVVVKVTATKGPRFRPTKRPPRATRPVFYYYECRFLTQTWNWEKLNMANATDYYNQALRTAGVDHQIIVDPAPDGWETKVAQMIQDNELLWNGHLRATSLGDISRINRLGILQPWDEFINRSTVPWAGQFWDEGLAPVKAGFTIDDKLYALPWDSELYCRVYNKTIWDTIGETPAETLDEFERQLEEIKAANPDKTPMCLRHNDLCPDQHMLMQLWTDAPWVEIEGGAVLDVKGEAYAEMLTLLKRWYDKGIITDESWDRTMYDSWNTGNTATGQSGAAWLQATAQKIFGRTNIIPMNNFVINKGDQPKTLTFSNGAMLFKGAAEPQEITDWLLWMVDPTVEEVANYSFIRAHLDYYHIPVYQSIYEDILPTNPDWAWMAGILDMVRASTPCPPNAFTAEIVPIVNAWEEKFVRGQTSLDEAINGMYDEFMDAVANALTG